MLKVSLLYKNKHDRSVIKVIIEVFMDASIPVPCLPHAGREIDMMAAKASIDFENPSSGTPLIVTSRQGQVSSVKRLLSS